MKKLFSVAVVLLVMTSVIYAQPGRGPAGERAKDKIEAFKIAFYTEKLQLTPEESKAFWPVFNQFENERNTLREKNDLEGKRIELMSDKDIEAAIMRHIEMEEQLVKLRRDYMRRFMEVLPVRKVALLQRIDNEFKRALLEELRKRRDERRK